MNYFENFEPNIKLNHNIFQNIILVFFQSLS